MISVIICSIDAAKFARVTANYRELLAGHPHEIIGIHDARSLSEGYNRGSRQARGELLIFSHDDIEIVSPDLVGAITSATAQLDVIGVVGTSKVLAAYWPAAGHPYLHGWVAQPAPDGQGFYVGVFGVDGALSTHLQGLDGLFFVATRSVTAAVPFDEVTFDGFHGYDMDFSFGAHLAGFRVGTTAEIAVIHSSSGRFGGDAWQRCAERFVQKYRDHIPAGQARARSPFFRALVGSKDAIARDFPVRRLVKITRRFRARAEWDAWRLEEPKG